MELIGRVAEECKSLLNGIMRDRFPQKAKIFET